MVDTRWGARNPPPAASSNTFASGCQSNCRTIGGLKTARYRHGTCTQDQVGQIKATPHTTLSAKGSARTSICVTRCQSAALCQQVYSHIKTLDAPRKVPSSQRTTLPTSHSCWNCCSVSRLVAKTSAGGPAKHLTRTQYVVRSQPRESVICGTTLIWPLT